MKKYKYIAVCLMASVLLTTGCADSFLEVSSPTDETIDTYFTTDEHIQEAVVAAYDPLHWPDWAFDEYNPVNLMSDIMADDLWVGGDSKTDNQPWHLMMNFEAIPTNMIYGLWKCAYSGVKLQRRNNLSGLGNRCNRRQSRLLRSSGHRPARILLQLGVEILGQCSLFRQEPDRSVCCRATDCRPAI